MVCGNWLHWCMQVSAELRRNVLHSDIELLDLKSWGVNLIYPAALQWHKKALWSEPSNGMKCRLPVVSLWLLADDDVFLLSHPLNRPRSYGLKDTDEEIELCVFLSWDCLTEKRGCNLTSGWFCVLCIHCISLHYRYSHFSLNLFGKGRCFLLQVMKA